MKSPWILLIGHVNDAPYQVRYQRILSLANTHELFVVTSSPLPSTLRDAVAEVHVAGGTLAMWRLCFELVRRLKRTHGSVVLHTVYAPRQMLAGFLSKRLQTVHWIYDLYDHPSLTWSQDPAVIKLFKRICWALFLRNFVRHADVWVVGMHPAVLSEMPAPKSRCRLILTSPGYGELATCVAQSAVMLQDSPETRLRLCYVGPVQMSRGLAIILEWARNYSGPLVDLELIGRFDSEAKQAVTCTQQHSGKELNVHISLHGWLPRADVFDVLSRSDIGLCMVDPSVFNYRYAYPIKLLEYMSQGLVTVATDSYGVRAYLRNGKNGFVCAYNSGAFGSALEDAMDACRSATRRAEISNGARETLADQDWPSINRKLIAELDDAVSIVS